MNCEVNVAIINLLAMSGQTIPLAVLVVPCITTPLQCCYAIVFHTFRIFPWPTDKEFDISPLVGADYYWDIVVDRIMGFDDPTAELGYLLTGPAPVTTGLVSTVS